MSNKYLRGQSTGNEQATPFQAFISVDTLDFNGTFQADIVSGQGPYTYLWDFGDGNTSTMASPTHEYDQPGAYTVTLQVADATGASISNSFEVIISDGTLPSIDQIRLWNADVDLSEPSGAIRALGVSETIDLDLYPDGIGFEAVLTANNAPFSRVEFYLDGALVGSQSGVPLTYPGDVSNGSYLYIPPWQEGPGNYTLEAIPFDDQSQQGIGKTVSLTVIQNSAPVANDVSLNLGNGQSDSVDISALVSDPDGTIDFSTLEIVGTPENVSATVSGSNINVTAQQDDSLAEVLFRVKDNLGKVSNTATITIEIGDFHEAPQLDDFSVSIPADTPTLVDVAGRAVDTTDGIDASSVQIESSLITGATLSLATGTDEGKVLVTPNAGFNGLIYFQFSVADANASPKRSRIATVSAQIGEPQIQTLYDDYANKPISGEFRYEILPPGDRADWQAIADQHLGGPVVNVPAGSSHSQAQNIINSAAEGSVIRFATGNYTWTGTCTINNPNRRVEIPQGVVINMNFSPGYRRSAFIISGGGPTGSNYSFTAQDFLHGREVQLQDASSFSVGDFVTLTIPFRNYTYTSANQWTLPNGVEVNRKQNLARIVSKSGNTLTLDRKIAMPPEWNDYPQYAELRKTNLLEGVVIAGKGEISYTQLLGSTVGYSTISNKKTNWSSLGFGGSVIIVEDTYKCSIQGTIMRDTPTTFLWVMDNSHFHVDDVEFLGTHNTGQGGVGYDIGLQGTSVFSCTNLYCIRTRHGAPATSLNGSNTCGHVHYRYLSTNIDYHGAGDCLITVVVDQFHFWHNNNGFRHTDYRSKKVPPYAQAWIRGVTKSGTANYDSIFFTLGDGDMNFQAVPQGDHNPGFRIYPGPKWSDSGHPGGVFPVGDGHMSSWIIGTTGPWLITINPGVGRLRQSDIYGGMFIIPDPSGQILQRTIANFKLSNSSKTSQGNLVVICSGVNGITDFTSAMAAISDVGGSARLSLGGSSYIELEGIAKASLSEAHVKVVDTDILRYWQGKNYIRHMFWGDLPYLRSVSPQIGTQGEGTSAEVSHTFNRAVSHNPGAGTGYILDEQGNVFLSLNPSTHFTISGSKVTYNLPGLVSGQWYRFELPPQYFVDSSGAGIMPIFDWHPENRPSNPYNNLHYWQA